MTELRRPTKPIHIGSTNLSLQGDFFFAPVSRNWPNYEANKSPCSTEADRGNAESGTASNVIDLILRFSDRQTDNNEPDE